MTLTTSRTILTIVLVIWVFTLLRSITIMISGKKIFIKASKGEKSCYIPILNLFSMLEIADISTFFGILFFVPVANIILLTVMSYKLGTAFQVGLFYKLGLVIMPIICYATLGSSKYIYKLKDENYFKALGEAKAENLNLMTEEVEEETPKSLEEQYAQEEENKVEVDSIFKSNVELMEQAAPYKAAKIDLIGMNKLKDAQGDKKEEKKKDDIEMIDL